MRRRAESLLPWLVLVGFLVAAFAVNALLTNAQKSGVDALEESVTGEVTAIAASQDQRFQNTFGATQGLSNPENPFQPEDKQFYEPRPPHSILPRPWYYFHYESLVVGAIIYGASGSFIPIPIDSVLGTLSPGGGDEFQRGLDETFKPGTKTHSATFLHQAIGLTEP